MAALTAVTPSNAGTVVAGAAVAASDTIDQGQLGPKGAILEILNGSGSTDTMSISDPGATPAGNPLTGGTIAATVGATSNKVFLIRREQVGSSGLITITHSQTTTVTYKLYPVG